MVAQPMSAKWPGWLRAALDAANALPPGERADAVRAAFAEFQRELDATGMCRTGCGEKRDGAVYCRDCGIRKHFRNEKRKRTAVSEGLCYTCEKRPGVAGKRGKPTYCVECREKRKEGDRARFLEAKQAKLCTQCRAAPAGRFVMCRSCRVKSNDVVQERQHDLRKRGICVVCGKNETGGARMCRVCADRHNTNRKQNRKKDGETRILDAMKVVLEYETEWFATGVVVKDERYLVAKEIVESKAI